MKHLIKFLLELADRAALQIKEQDRRQKVLDFQAAASAVFASGKDMTETELSVQLALLYERLN